MRLQDQDALNGVNEERDAANAAAEPSEGLFADIDPEVIVDVAVGVGFPAVKALLILFIGWIIAGWVRRLTRRGMERARIEPTITAFAANLARWGVLVLAAIFILSVFGIETASIAVVFGGMALALGLALQGTLGNAAAGFMLLLFRPFKVGDVVNAAGVTGKVVEIELFSTIIDTFDNRRLIVPNGSIFGSTIENINHHPIRRVDVQVGVAYDADITRTREVLKQAAENIEEGLDDPAPAIVLNELADSSVNWTVRVWTDTANYWPVRDKLTEGIKQALDEAGLTIPFPQMDVHLKNQPPAGTASASGT